MSKPGQLKLSIVLNCICFLIISVMAVRKYNAYHQPKTIEQVDDRPAFFYKINKQWAQFKTMYDYMPVSSGKIVFLGNSLVADCNWSELLNNPNVVNRGIGGDCTEGMLTRLSAITKLHPSKIFIMTGTNDIGLKYSPKQFKVLYQRLIDSLQGPKTKLYLLGIIPRNDTLYKKVPLYNATIRSLAKKPGCRFVDLYPLFDDSTGHLKASVTNDGYHLMGHGYVTLATTLKPYVQE